MENRYSVTPSKKKTDCWVLFDNDYKIVFEWENGKFNETQTITFLEDLKIGGSELTYMMAKVMREAGDYLAKYHYEKIF